MPNAALILTGLVTIMSAISLTESDARADAPTDLERCNVVFDTPSADASGAVPIGNGFLGASVWFEPSGDLVMYISSPDSFSGNAQLLKIGKVRIHFTPSPLGEGVAFRQELKLREGRLEADLGATRVQVFVETGRPVIRVIAVSPKPFSVHVANEGWRTRQMPDGTRVDGAGKDPADVVVATAKDAVCWYHRNESTEVAAGLKLQSCEGLPGAFDPLLHRTFGAWIGGAGLKHTSELALDTAEPVTSLDVRIACPVLVSKTADEWTQAAWTTAAQSVEAAEALAACASSWQKFWDRSWIFVSGDLHDLQVPANEHPWRIGIDSEGGNRFPGEIGRVGVYSRDLNAKEVEALAAGGPNAPATVLGDRVLAADKPAIGYSFPDSKGVVPTPFTLEAWVNPVSGHAGRIFDKLTAGHEDGVLMDTLNGHDLRVIIGHGQIVSFGALKPGSWQHVAVVVDAETVTPAIYVNGKLVQRPRNATSVSQAYALQRYVTGCAGLGEFPIKFNGGIFTVEPQITDAKEHHTPDWRRWGGDFWYQNTRHMYAPLPVSGDFDLMGPFFALYQNARPLAEARTQKWYNAQGAFFPETMTLFGTYPNDSYGLDRQGKQAGDVQTPWWRWAWNQGPELVTAMLDYWEWTQDQTFARQQLLPMADSVLRYFDTRFRKDDQGRIIIDPDQTVETYWTGVINDLPTTAGLRSVTGRLTALPQDLTTPQQRQFFQHMLRACPEIATMEVTREGKLVKVLAPAQKFDPKRSNCENAELYAIWPFRLYGVGKADLQLARDTYAVRPFPWNSNGWGYDGNAAAVLGLDQEAKRIMLGKCANSHPAHRFPATWGPNFDWIPDQNHGGNLMNTLELMLLQADGRKILLLPAWPKEWNCRFRLHAPMQTVVEGEVVEGRLLKLTVTPASRVADVVNCWER